ncbi:MAG: hypothetical protein ACD_46C00686G0001 [uncultured bacterium]|nr:MAG: hypothetical protein ACD_46C00686G0001 [uncultured bacterium]
MFAAGQVTWISLLLGSLVGVGMGVIFGLFMYYGLLRVSIKYTFQFTSILLTFIAAGMAANAAGKLVKAGLLPIIINTLWDTSSLLSQKSIIGRFLYILVGYQDHPNGMQALFYIGTIAVIYFVSRSKLLQKA